MIESIPVILTRGSCDHVFFLVSQRMVAGQIGIEIKWNELK